MGWLLKPSFTKLSQDRDTEGLASPTKKLSGNIFSDFKNRVKGSMISPYKRRWFVLSTEKRCLIYYKDDTAGIAESGFIDISQIIDVQRSNLSDAPPFAIDLMSKDRCFTIAAESEYQMLLWAYAINACRPQKIEGCKSPHKPTDMTDAATRASKWSRYEYTFTTPGPLMLNVMGTSNKDKKTGKVINNWIIVTSFESTVDGKPGRAETTGVISVKDYLVAVNGVDLMKHTFNESMNIINKATFPKIVTFLKDNGADRTASRAEGWAIVYYPSLNRRRRRYVDIRWDSINFRKPAPGGSANAQRDAYISLGMVESIQPIVDNTMLSDQRFVLRVTCKEGALMDHVGDDDKTIGTSSVPYLDLCFAKESQMKSWRSILASPSIYTAFETASVPVSNLEVIDVETTLPQISGEWSNMAIKSELTGYFAPREFTVVRGHVHWMRVGQKQQMSRKKSIELAGATRCYLKSARAVEVPETGRNAYKYQLILTVKDRIITIGMKDEAAILRWLDLIREAITIAPVEDISGVYVSTAVEQDEIKRKTGESSPTTGERMEDEEEETDLVTHIRATELEGATNGLQGTVITLSHFWMFYLLRVALDVQLFFGFMTISLSFFP